MFYKFGDSTEEVKEFLEKHPEDEPFRDVLNAIRTFVAGVAPPSAEETPLEAKRRIEQGFDGLQDQIDADLKTIDRNERQARQAEFVNKHEADIKARHLQGIIQNPHLRGQFACDEEIRHFRDGLKSNPDLFQALTAKGETQAVRQTAAREAVDLARGEFLKQHGLDAVKDERTAPLLPWEGEVAPRTVALKRSGPKR